MVLFKLLGWAFWTTGEEEVFSFQESAPEPEPGKGAMERVNCSSLNMADPEPNTASETDGGQFANWEYSTKVI